MFSKLFNYMEARELHKLPATDRQAGESGRQGLRVLRGGLNGSWP